MNDVFKLKDQEIILVKIVLKAKKGNAYEIFWNVNVLNFRYLY